MSEDVNREIAAWLAVQDCKKYGIPARDLLVELGRRGMVGGQEDMIEDTALTMARERGLKLPA